MYDVIQNNVDKQTYLNHIIKQLIDVCLRLWMEISIDLLFTVVAPVYSFCSPRAKYLQRKRQGRARILQYLVTYWIDTSPIGATNVGGARN